MKRNFFIRRASFLLTLALVLSSSGNKTATAVNIAVPVAPSTVAAAEGNINVNGFFSVERAQRGSSFQAAIVLDIPGGLHVNSNKPLGKYSVPTTIKIEAPRGFRVTPVTYPRAIVRNFKFGDEAPNERLAVYEGRAIARFNVTVPANFETGVTNVRVNVRYQSCSNEVCFPPATRQLTLAIAIVGANESAPRINGQYFGNGGRKRR
ncbi:MAG: protein-disulfide reductase DsbD domain-containing protein [Pyrinomonadaceae bacterium]